MADGFLSTLARPPGASGKRRASIRVISFGLESIGPLRYT